MPAGLSTRQQLGQRLRRVGHGAQREGAERGVAAGVVERERLPVEPDVLDAARAPPGCGARHAGGPRCAGSTANTVVDLGRVVGQVQTRAEADLDHASREALGRARARHLSKPLEPQGPLHQPRHDLFAVDAHATTLSPSLGEESPPWRSTAVHSSPAPAAASAGPSRSSWRAAASTPSRPCGTPPPGPDMAEEADGRLRGPAPRRHRPRDVRPAGRPTGAGQQRRGRHRRTCPSSTRTSTTGAACSRRTSSARWRSPLRRSRPCGDNRPSVICTITSSSIIAAVPFYSAYRASKAAASAFCDSLRVEVAPFGIRVVEILPGPVDTDMFRLSTGEQDAARFPEYRALADIAGELRRAARRPAGGRTGRGGLGHRRRDRGLVGTDALRLRPGVARADGPVAPERRRDGVRR